MTCKLVPHDDVKRLLLTVAIFAFVGAQSVTPAHPAITVLLPLHGIDAAEGIEDATAVRLAAAEARAGIHVVITDVTRGEVQNPHQDEGTDNERDVAGAMQIARSSSDRFAALVGGSRRNVAASIAAVQPLVPFVSMSTPGRARAAFCLCRDDASLRRAIVQATQHRFGSRTLLLTRDPAYATRLRSGGVTRKAQTWRDALAGLHLDAVILELGDGRFVAERAPARALLDETYLIALGHRDAPSTPPAVHDALAWGPYPLVRSPSERAFEGRFRRAYGTVPFSEAAYAFAAAQIAISAVRRSTGMTSVRQVLKTGSFTTILGVVRFDANGAWVNAPIASESR